MKDCSYDTLEDIHPIMFCLNPLVTFSTPCGYIIGNIKNSSITDIVKKHLTGPGIKVLPFDVGFMDAFDHTTTLLIYEAK